jgi:hypothetical protein
MDVVYKLWQVSRRLSPQQRLPRHISV